MDRAGGRGGGGVGQQSPGRSRTAPAHRPACSDLAGPPDPRGGRSDHRTLIVGYTAMPLGALPRPLADVEIEDAGLLVKGLVDTGAVNTLFGDWIADETGVDLTGIAAQPVSVGGMTYTAR